MTAALLEVSGLSVHLRAREVLSEIDLSFAQGEMTVVIGPNGAGKTTLMRALAGLVAPARGVVRLQGQNVRAMERMARGRALAYLPQNGSIAWPLPVRDVVALGRLPHGASPGSLDDRGREAVAAAIAAVGLRGLEDRPATQLSGGERARALLARALATEAPILIADEPVAALDPRHQLLILDVLRTRARDGLVVAVMHDLALAARFAHRMVLLHGHRVAAAGPPQEVLTAAHLAAAFGIEATVAYREGGLEVAIRRALQL